MLKKNIRGNEISLPHVNVYYEWHAHARLATPPFDERHFVDIQSRAQYKLLLTRFKVNFGSNVLVPLTKYLLASIWGRQRSNKRCLELWKSGFEGSAPPISTWHSPLLTSPSHLCPPNPGCLFHLHQTRTAPGSELRCRRQSSPI